MIELAQEFDVHPNQISRSAGRDTIQGIAGFPVVLFDVPKSSKPANGIQMLYTDEERAVMAEAIQPNMRSTNISVTSFQNILADYLSDFRFQGARVLDIGPGQLDLLDIARDKESAQTVGIDFDPAIQALGSLRGHDIRLFNLTKGWPLPDQTFDLIFCRGSINCFWYPSEARLREFLDGLSGSLADSGRLWIAPWNKPAPAREALVDAFDATISDWARENGISVETPDRAVHARYGIGYGIPRVDIWRR